MSQFQMFATPILNPVNYIDNQVPNGITFDFARSVVLSVIVVSTNDSQYPASSVQYSLNVTPSLGIPAGAGNSRTYTVTIAYIDPYTGDGVLSSNTASVTINIIAPPPDTTPPTISLNGATTYTFYRSNFTTTVPASEIATLINASTTISDNQPGVYRSITPTVNNWSPSSWPANRSYNVVAIDAAGNVSNDSITISFNYIDDVLASVDTTPPSLSLSQAIFNFYVTDYPSGLSSVVVTTAVNAAITATDDSGTVFIDFNPAIQSMSVPSLGQSLSINYTVKARDPSNNFSDEKTFTVNYINDTPPPSDIIPPQIIGNDTVSILASENRDVNYILTLYTLFDNSGVVSWYQMVNFPLTTVGSYVIQLKAIDGAGLITTRNITVFVLATPPVPDTTPPTINGQTNITINKSQGFTEQVFINTFFTITDNVGVATSFLNPSVLFNQAGTYSTALFASDLAGNTTRFPSSPSNFIIVTVIDDGEPIPTPEGNNIIENIYIGDELMTNKIKLGFSFNDKIDVELDNATIIVPFSTRSEPYRPFTQVKFYFKGVTQPSIYYITDDSVARVSSGTPLFQHNIVLIEPIKILERFKCVNMTFTQPIDNSFAPYTLLDVINRIDYNNPLKIVGENDKHWDSIDTTLSNLLASIKAPQLQFNSMTIREALDRTFQYINAVARLEIQENGSRVLKADFFNTTDTLINLENTLNISRQQGSEFFAENSELTVENATTEYATVKYPSYGWAGVRAEGRLVDTSNLRFEVPFPIYEILSFKVFARVIAFRGAASDSVYTETDITPYVLEKQLYDGLPVGTLAIHNAKQKHSFNTLYYSRGDNKIYNIGTIADLSPLSFLDNARVIDLVFDTVYGTDFDARWNPVKFSDLLFRIEYRTLLTSRLRFMRDVKQDFFGTIHTNQMENIVDLESLGANARGVLNRVGNTDLNATKLVKTWNERFKVGQFTNDGFIATNVENAVFTDHIRSTAQFTKEYNGLSKFVGVDTEVRQIPIPYQTTNSTLHYDQYAIIDTQPKTSLYSHFGTSYFVNQFADYLKQIDDKTFTDTFKVETTTYQTGARFTVPNNYGVVTITLTGNVVNDTSNPLEILVMKDPEFPGQVVLPTFYYQTTGEVFSEKVVEMVLQAGVTYTLYMTRDVILNDYIFMNITYITPYQFDKYAINFSSYTSTGSKIAQVLAAPDISSVNNSIKIDFKFDDNLSAGLRIERNVATTELTGQRRVFYTNSLGRFSFFDFKVAKVIEPTSDEGKLTLADRLPSVTNSDFEDELFSSLLMRYQKDNTENFGLTYQTHFVVSDNLNNHLVIGKKFLTKWFASDNVQDVRFRLYRSYTQSYNKFDNEKVKGALVGVNNAYTVTIVPDTKQIKIEILENVANTKSFAIGTENGDLVLGFNPINPYTSQYKDLTTIYISFTDERS